MYKCLLLSALLFATSCVAHARQTVPATEESKPVHQKTSVALVGAPDHSRQKDTLFFTPSDENAVGVLVDYRPFSSSGFNLSAGSVTNLQTHSPRGQLPIQRAYLGVGWKKLVDDAQNFGVRVDFGAIYDDHPELEHGPSSLNSSTDSSLQAAPSEWIPVISFGVSYRF